MTHHYKRNGTRTLFAALDVLAGAVIGQCPPRHRHSEFFTFPKTIDGQVPEGLPTHLQNCVPLGSVWLAIAGADRGWMARLCLVVTTVLLATSMCTAATALGSPPTVSSLTPSDGPTAGGTLVEIAGSEFTDGATVNFGSTPAAGVKFDSSSLITATSPEGTGAVRVTVTDSGGASTLGPDNWFSYRGGTGLNYLAQIGAEGSGGVPVADPVDVAIAPSGNIWAAEWSNDTVAEYSPSGTLLTSIKAQEAASIERPNAIAISPGGDIWVLDSNQGRLVELNEEGQEIKAIGEEGSEPGQFSYPTGLAIGAEGNIWVADTNNGRVQEFSESGELLAIIGQEGAHALDHPSAVAIAPGGEIWIENEEAGSTKVEEFTSEGSYIRELDIAEADPEANSESEYVLHGLAVEAGGSVWLGDIPQERILEFDEVGHYLGSIGSEGSGSGEVSLEWEMGLAFDTGNNIWVSDGENDRLEEWGAPPAAPANTEPPSIDGELVEGASVAAVPGTWSGSPAPTYSYQWKSCNAAGEDCAEISGATDDTYKIPSSLVNSTLKVIVTAKNASGSASTESASTKPIAVVEAPANTTLPTITGEAEAGETLTAHAGSWSGEPHPTYSYQWRRCDKAGNECSSIAGATESTYVPREEDIGSTIRVVVTAENAAGTSTATSEVSSVVTPSRAPASLTPPEISGKPIQGETLTASGGTWSGAPLTSEKYQWERCNNENIGATGSGEGQLSSPDDFALDEEGDLWVLDTGDSRVEEFGSSGESLQTFGTEGTQTGKLENPDGIAVGPEDEIWVADTGNKRVEEYSSSGTLLKALTLTFSGPTYAEHDVEYIAVTPGRDIWVTNPRGAVAEFNYSGSKIHQFSTAHEEERLALSPKGDLWMSSASWARLEEYSPEGELLATVTEAGAHDLDAPEGIAVASDGDVWVADATESRINHFAENGEYLGDISLTEEQGEGEIRALALGASGDVLALHEDNIETFSAAGTYLSNETCQPIAGATDDAYTVTSKDVEKRLRVAATGSNAKGAATAASSRTAVAPNATPPKLLSTPETSGTAEVGETLKGIAGELSGTEPIELAYQWESCNANGEECSPISHAIDEYLTLVKGDVGSTIRFTVTAESPYGAETKTSSVTAVVASAAAPTSAGAPRITGTDEQGQTLNSSPGEWTGVSPTAYEYQWQRCNATGGECMAIEGATRQDYVPAAEDLSATLRVRVTASNEAGSGEASSAATEPIEAGPPVSVGAPVVHGAPQPGQELTARVGTWHGTAPIEYQYQWQHCTDGAAGAEEEGIGSPEAVAVDANGDVWAVYPDARAVDELTETGELIRILGAEALDTNEFGGPASVAAGDTGDVWVAMEGGELVELGPGGESLDEVTPQGTGFELGTPSSLAITRSGDFWVAYAEDDQVVEFNPGGLQIRQLNPEREELLARPAGVAVTTTGDLWVANSESSTLQEFSEDGAFVRELAKVGAPGHLGEPTGIAADTDGGIWVANFEDDYVEQLGPTGDYLEGFEVDAGFRGPMGVAIGKTGTVWVPITRGLDDLDEGGALARDVTERDCVNIEGATSQGYTVTEADLGERLQVKVTAINAEGSAQALSTPTSPSQTGPPAEVQAPQISGIDQVGSIIEAGAGQWAASGEVSYAYQWESCSALGEECAPLEGASGRRYELGEGDIGTTIRVSVTATDSIGSSQSASKVTQSITPEPAAELQAPSISGIPDAGDFLVAEAGEWAGTGTETVLQWESCNSSGAECAPVEGATEANYTLGQGDIGTTVRLRVGAENAVDAISDVSEPTPVIGEPEALASTKPPTITGEAQVGAELAAKPGTWTQEEASYAYQWQACNRFGESCAEIAGASSQTYTPEASQAGSRLRVLVTAEHEAQQSTRASTPTQPIAEAEAPRQLGAPTLAGAPLEGHLLRADHGEWTATTPISYSYRWARCTVSEGCQIIAGANADEYTVTAADHGTRIVALITAEADGHETEAVSEPTPAIATAALSRLSEPSISPSARRGVEVTAEPGITVGEGPVEHHFQWERCNPDGKECATIGGAIKASYSPVAADEGQAIRVQVATQGPLGEETSLSASTLVFSEGHITPPEALEEAHRLDPALIEPSLEATLEGESIKPALSQQEEELVATGTLTSSSIALDAPGSFSVSTPDGEIGIVPQEAAADAEATPTLTNGTAALFADTWPSTDTIVRPTPLGVATTLQIRSPGAPRSFSWEVHLGLDQALKLLPDGGVAIVGPTEANDETESVHEEREAAEEEAETSGENVEPELGAESGEGEPTEGEESEELEGPSLEAAPAPALATVEAGEPSSSGLPAPQQTEDEYEAASTAFKSAETVAGTSALMAIAPPEVTTESGEAVEGVAYTVAGNVITLTLPAHAGSKPLLATVKADSESNKSASKRRAALRYGLSDETATDYTEHGPAGESGTGLDPNLRNGPLKVKVARRIIAFNALTSGALSQHELSDSGSDEATNLATWLKDVEGEGLEPYITFGQDCYRASGTCGKVNPAYPKPVPTVSEYEKAITKVVKEYDGQVKIWGAWNEPDRGQPMGNHPQLAAQYWEAARRIIGKLCSKCQVVAGEFSEDLRSSKLKEKLHYPEFIERYIATLLCHPGKAKCAGVQRYVPASVLPEVWGFHDYHDVINQTGVTKCSTRLKELAGCTFVGMIEKHEQLDHPRIWFTEQGVELLDGNEEKGGDPFTRLDEKSKSSATEEHQREIDAARQRAAATRFLDLHNVAPKYVEVVNYYMYEQPSVGYLNAHPFAFDSGMLENSLVPRPAYCVLAYEAHRCKPGVITGEEIKAPDGRGSSNVCRGEPVDVTLDGVVIPEEDASASYFFEYSPNREFTKAGKTALHVTDESEPSSVSATVAVATKKSDANCKSIYFRLVGKGVDAAGESTQLTYGATSVVKFHPYILE